MNLVGQVFGNREVIREECTREDWLNIGLKVPSRTDKYKLTKCRNCGRVLPTLLRNMIEYPPKRCVFCSNIGNHSHVETDTNSWAIYEDYAVCNVIFKGKVVSFYIDSNEYEKVSRLTWRISQKRQKYYVITGSAKKGTMIYLHSYIYGPHDDDMEIDHIDGNSLNNRRANLHVVTRQENIDNQIATRIDNTIGIRGISFDKRNRKYTVDFNYHGVRYYTKQWNTIEEAVWCRYCYEEHFGIHALQNNPLANQYYILPNEKKDEIKQYVTSKILRNER